MALWDDDIIGTAVPPDSAKALIRTITTEFLTQFSGMPMHKAQAELGSDRGILPTLITLDILWSADAIYFPGFCALYFMNPSVRREAERHVHSFLEFAKDLYSERGTGPYFLRQICADLGTPDGKPIHARSLIVGAHLARSFHAYFYSFEGSPKVNLTESQPDGPPNIPEMRFSLSDGILDYKDLDAAWETQLRPHFRSWVSSPGPIRPDARRSAGNNEWDVFICHASEDKEYAEPLAVALEAAGVRVWFDRITLEWGDDLRPAIDRGVAACRYGIVVLSKSFLARKKWTEYELNSLFAREQAGKKLILPIWHGITRDDLIQYGPAFADRLAKISSVDTYADIVRSLLAMLGRLGPADSRKLNAPVSTATKPSRAKPNAVAYAQYETKGQNALKADAYVRPSPEKEEWFTFENSFGEQAHGERDEIAQRFAAFDKSLIAKGYVRMNHGNSGDPTFNL